MAKLVVLEIGQGSFEQGFPVTLQISEEGAAPTVKKIGQLPPAPEMPLYYDRWQAHYKELDQIYRLSAVASPPPSNVSRQQLVKKCEDLAAILRARLNAWIRTDPFETIRTTWLKEVNSDEVVRAIMQVCDREMQQLPWHLLDMVQGYAQLEIAVGSSYEKPFTKPTVHTTVNILAILGDSRGINTKTDAALLNQLPNTEVEFLAEPKRSQLTDRLWEKPWDILFFAGHSASKENYESGVIYLNATDKLTVSELKFALRKAVEKGLKLAIFNSCDGLGLARELADLHIPQVIVMREPVPDRVAQAFLKYFLQAYAQGEPLYLAVRQARERLEGMEDEFPCATWLPMIFQNLAELPPTWKLPDSMDDCGDSEVARKLRRRTRILGSVGASVTSVLLTAAIAGIRHQGWLQQWELQAYDSLMQMRSIVQPEIATDQAKNNRLLVIEVDDGTYEEEQQKGKPLQGKSLSDPSLIKLLDILEKHRPAAIGLDLERQAQSADAKTVSRLKQSKDLFGICFRPNLDNPGFRPPQGIQNVGFSDFIVDSQTQEVRRHLLYAESDGNAVCNVQGALSTELALAYLKKRGIEMATVKDSHTQQEYMRLGKVTFRHFNGRPGGYQRERFLSHQHALNRLGGSQILLNYRDAPINAIPVNDVLTGRLQAQDIRDRIILIGVTRASVQDRDRFLTPYSRGKTVPGVFIHAQMVNQILSAVLDNRPLLQVWDEWLEITWIGGWGLVGALGVGLLRGRLARWVGIAISGSFLYGGCLYLLLWGYWVPLLPAAIGLMVTSGSLVLYQVFVKERSWLSRSAKIGSDVNSFH